MGGSALGLAYGMDISPQFVVDHLSMAAQSQITQAGFFFTLAAWLHAGRVKSEIKLNFSSLTDALNNLGDALRNELKNHADQLAAHAKMLDTLGKTVEELAVKPNSKTGGIE